MNAASKIGVCFIVGWSTTLMPSIIAGGTVARVSAVLLFYDKIDSRRVFENYPPPQVALADFLAARYMRDNK